MQRRHFLRAAGLSAAGLVAGAVQAGSGSRTRTSSTTVPPVPADTGAAGRVLVIGGGMAGTTAAKYLRLWGGQKVQVTMIERETSYVSNIMSNLVLNGGRTIAGLTYNWDRLVANYGVNRARGDVTTIDPVARKVFVGTTRYDYDRLVIAPGIAFDPIAGLDTDALRAQFPHAWQAGAQDRGRTRAAGAGRAKWWDRGPRIADRPGRDPPRGATQPPGGARPARPGGFPACRPTGSRTGAPAS